MRIRSRGVSTCSGPNHAATSSGSVQALNTRSRGASKMRVIRTSWSAAPTGVESLILLSFPAQVRVESVHPGLPRPLARLHPLHCLVERLCLQPARSPLSVPAADDQSGALEHLEVARDRRQAHREGLRQLVHGRLALGETGDDRAARRIGQSGEGEAELVGRHVTVWLINVIIKYQLRLQNATGPRRVSRRAHRRPARNWTRPRTVRGRVESVHLTWSLTSRVFLALVVLS